MYRNTELPITEPIQSKASCAKQMDDSTIFYSKQNPEDDPQQRCIDANPDAEVFFTQFMPNSKAMKFAATSLSNFLELTQTDHHLCEWRIPDRPCRFFFDWDGGDAMTLGAGFADLNLRGDEAILAIASVVAGIVEDFFAESGYEDAAIQMVHACNGTKKLSYHGVVTNCTLANQDDLNIMGKKYSW
jgi:hypothetical protein